MFWSTFVGLCVGQYPSRGEGQTRVLYTMTGLFKFQVPKKSKHAMPKIFSSTVYFSLSLLFQHFSYEKALCIQ